MTTWTDEQLAAYASGELDARDQHALEDGLATDPELVARLERIRRVDALLAGLERPVPDPAFSRLLREATDVAVAEVVGDELAARRARRDHAPRWTGWVLGGAAAVVAAVVGVTLATGGLGSGDSDLGVASRDLVETPASDEAAAAEGGEQEAADAAMAAPATDTRPVVADVGDVLDDDALEEFALAARRRVGSVDPSLAEEIAATNAVVLRARGDGQSVAGGDASEATASTELDADTADTDPEPAAPGAVVVEGDVDESELDRIGECLVPVLDSVDGGATVLPMEARLGTRDGDEVIAYLLLGVDPETGGYDRVETWVVDRATCSVLEFRQTS